jgi:hypothetical protein
MRIFPIPQRQCCELALVSMLIRFHHFTSMRIRIRMGAKPMRINADPDPGHWSDFAVTKSWIFTCKNILYVPVRRYAMNYSTLLNVQKPF